MDILDSSHVARAEFSPGPDNSGHLITAHKPSKHIGALPIVLITIGTCIFIGIIALVIYPAICERLFGRPSPLRSRHRALSLWHSPVYINWGSTPLFKRPDGGIDLLQRRSSGLHRKAKSLDVSSRASSGLSVANVVTSLSEKNLSFSALYSGMADSPLRDPGETQSDLGAPQDLQSIFMSTFQKRLSISNRSTDSTDSTRGIAPASLACSLGSDTWTNSIATFDIHTLYSQRFSRDSVYSQEAPATSAAVEDVLGLAAHASIDPDNNAAGSARYSTESYLAVPGRNVWRHTTTVDDPEAQRAAIYF